MILTEQEVFKCLPPEEDTIAFARAIESAVLEKLKAQEPFGYYWNYQNMEDGIIIGQYFAEGEAEEQGYTPLYTHPLPPADVVRDAERYRWLVDNSYDRDGFLQFQVWKHSWEPHSQTGVPIEWKCRVRGPAIDAAIDAAMKEMK